MRRAVGTDVLVAGWILIPRQAERPHAERPAHARVGCLAWNGLGDELVVQRRVGIEVGLQVANVRVVGQRQSIRKAATDRVAGADGQVEIEVAVEQVDVVEVADVVDLIRKESAIDRAILGAREAGDWSALIRAHERPDEVPEDVNDQICLPSRPQRGLQGKRLHLAHSVSEGEDQLVGH